MDRRRNLSGSSDDSDASENSIDLPPYFNCDGSKREEILQWKLQTFDTFKRTIEELQSEYKRNLPTLTDQMKKLEDFTDETESVHKGTEVGNLAGVSVGAAGGIAGLASIITNMVKQRKLRQTVEKIICDFLEILKPMTEHLSIISYITADVQRNNEMLNKLKFQTPVRGFDDLLKIVRVADVAIVGKYCAEAAKEICVYENNVRAVRGSAGAAKAKRVAATTGGLSALFLALDVAYIVQDSVEIAEMNQPAKERKAEEIKSQTRKFIHYTRETASQFQETLDKIKHVINTFN